MAETRDDSDWLAAINDTLASVKPTGDEDTKSPAYPVASDLAGYIDHTLLKLDATPEQIDRLCEEAKEHKFKSVCVRLPYVARCVQNLKGTGSLVACVVGFHEGTYATAEKVQEATAAVNSGASELDMVVNYNYLKKKAYSSVFHDIEAVRLAGRVPIVLKVILETSQLTHEEIVAGCVLAQAAGADFVKTSTGFNGRGASLEDVQVMKSVVQEGAKVKASGGVRSREDAIAMIRAGAERIGTSGGVAIVQGGTNKIAY